MTRKLQQAIKAARAGQKKEAQVLLTQILKDEPNDVHAWFLLSHVVESEQKQIAYLRKVLALEPGHEKAVQRLAQLETPKPLPVAEEMVEFDADESWDDTLTDLTPETTEEMSLEMALAPPQAEELVSPGADSLTVEPEPATTALAEVDDLAAPAATVAAKETSRQRQASLLTLGLIGLVAAATIVFIALLYAILTAF
jgi:hypothetical protein